MSKTKVPSYSTVVGRFVRLERECKKISLSAFASDLGYSSSGWSRVETGKTPMSVNQLRRACEILGTQPHKLLEEVDMFCKRNALTGGRR
jgi:transcriptional regulator with XRE-family HTH domain